MAARLSPPHRPAIAHRYRSLPPTLTATVPLPPTPTLSLTGPANGGVMDVREADLPGVGKKFALTTSEGERLTIIIHNTGDRELYNFRENEDFPFHALRLDDSEARKI